MSQPHPASIVPASSGLIAAVSGNATAMGESATTLGLTDTFAGGGMAIGVAAFAAAAQNFDGLLPHTAATATGIAGGGNVMTALSDTVTIAFPFGPDPVSETVAVTFVGAMGPASLSAELATHDAFSSLGAVTALTIV
jgi:hypothetical protein